MEKSFSYILKSSSQNSIVAKNNGYFRYIKNCMEEKTMSRSKINVPEAKEAMERFKMEAASEVGVNLKQGYNGDLTSRQAGSIGGQMVKKMVEDYENKIK